MSGHSKWSTIKRQKQADDKKRGQIFTKLARAITLSVKEGGGNIDEKSNFKLRLAIEQAKRYNMPKDNIARAIDRGSGKGGGADAIESIVYEGYGPYGVALIVECATDNKQRTSAQVKHALEHNGGNLSGSGSVLFQFEHVGLISVPSEGISEDKMLESAITAGARDVVPSEDLYEIYTDRDKLHEVKEELEKQSIPVEDAMLTYRPTSTFPLPGDTEKNAVSRLLSEIDDLDDVQAVYTNADLE